MKEKKMNDSQLTGYTYVSLLSMYLAVFRTKVSEYALLSAV